MTTPLGGVAATLAALVLVACSSGDADPAGRGSARPATTVPLTATQTACPDLEPVAPRAGGLPDLELPCLGDGPSVNLAHLRGVPTVVNVWAAWCTNCDREMPLFADAVERAGDDLRFFGVHYKAPRDFGLRSEQDFGVPFASVHDEDGDLIVEALRATAPPQTFFVTADGRIAGRKIGEITSADQMADLVRHYLGVTL
ncbi:MAG: TlpA family protein disulfide reductase [Actinomycetes bacterium]